MVYAYAEDAAINRWKLIDLDALRSKARNSEWLQGLRIKQASNGDDFYVVPLDELEHPIAAVGERGSTTTTTRTSSTEDDGEWETHTREKIVTTTTTTTIRRRKSEAALAAGYPCGHMGVAREPLGTRKEHTVDIEPCL